MEYLKDTLLIRHIHNSYNYDDYNILIKIHILNEIDSNIKNICTEIYNVIKYIYNKCHTNILYNQIGYTRINNNDKNMGILTICYSDDIKDTLIDTINGDITTSTFINGLYIKTIFY